GDPPAALAGLVPAGTVAGDADAPAGAPQHAAEMAPDGFAAVLLADPDRPRGDATLAVRLPGGRFVAAPAAGQLAGDEMLVQGAATAAARVLMAVTSGDDAARAVWIAPTTTAGAGTAVLRYAPGGGWTREPLMSTGGAVYPVGLAAASPDRAWLLARTGPDAGAAPALFHRVVRDGAPAWVPVAPPERPVLAAAPVGVDGVAVAAPPADPLTVTDDAVWVDLRVRAGGATRDAVVRLRPDGTAAATWCDLPAAPPMYGRDPAPACDHPLGFALPSAPRGYRSLAFPAHPGAPLGARVISGAFPADAPPGPRRESAGGGGFAALDGDVFVARDGIGDPGPDPTRAIAAAPDGRVVVGGGAAVGAYGPVTAAPAVRAPVPSDYLDTVVAASPDPAGGGRALAVTRAGMLALYVPDRGWTGVPSLTPPSEGSAGRYGVPRTVAWAAPNRVLTTAGGVVALMDGTPEPCCSPAPANPAGTGHATDATPPAASGAAPGPPAPGDSARMPTVPDGHR
ncbi:MAG: hypothetical protein KDC33_13180, partial [Thermoleophilia bacterium]|nr:hypothetical protein [Thermoleophilia bacterium]